MKEKYLHILIATCLLAAFASTCLAAHSSFQRLGDLPGGNSRSKAYGASADSLVVLGLSNKGPTDNKPFRWTAATPMQGLGYLPAGRSYSSAYAASPHGSIITGWSGSKLFRWVDLNRNGTVEINEKLDNHDEFGLGDFNHDEFGLGDFPAGIFTSNARGLTHDGSALVGMPNADRDKEAFSWTDFKSNGLIDLNKKLDVRPELGLGRLPGGSERNAAHDVSADPPVVGWANSESGRQAFRWQDLDEDGIVNNDQKLDTNPDLALGDLPDAPFNSTPYAVSADGSVVVGYGTADADRKSGLVDDWGLHLDGWTISQARGRADDSLAIIGVGINPDGYTKAWIAGIPEATALTLLGVGGLAFLKKRSM